MKICDLININELSVNFDLQVKYFLHIHCWEIRLIRTPVGSAPASLVLKFFTTRAFFIFGRAVLKFRTTASLPWPVVVTIQSTASFVFLAAIFYITIHFHLNFMFWGIICLNNVCST